MRQPHPAFQVLLLQGAHDWWSEGSKVHATVDIVQLMAEPHLDGQVGRLRGCAAGIRQMAKPLGYLNSVMN